MAKLADAQDDVTYTVAERIVDQGLRRDGSTSRQLPTVDPEGEPTPDAAHSLSDDPGTIQFDVLERKELAHIGCAGGAIRQDSEPQHLRRQPQRAFVPIDVDRPVPALRPCACHDPCDPAAAARPICLACFV